MIRIYAIAGGQVQGVGFRSFVQLHAVRYQCTGWVRNMTNNHVEMELQGNEEDIDRILDALRRGNQFIHVDELVCKQIDVKEESKFKIRM